MAVYPTGYSNTPIDFSRASNALLQTAMQQKVNEVKDKMATLDKNQQYIVKAMDIDLLPEIEGKMRETFDGAITDFKKRAADRLRQRDGYLTTSDKTAIDSEYKALVDGMNRYKLSYDALNKMHANWGQYLAQEKAGTLNARDLAIDLGKIKEGMANGQVVDVSEITSLPLKHMIQPTKDMLWADAFKTAKAKYGDIANDVDIKSEGGKWVAYTEKGREKLDKFTDLAFQMSPRLQDEYKRYDEKGEPIVSGGFYEMDNDMYSKDKSELVGTIYEMNTSRKELKPTGSGGGGYGGANTTTKMLVKDDVTPLGKSGNTVVLSGKGTVVLDTSGAVDDMGRKLDAGQVSVTPTGITISENGEIWGTYVQMGGGGYAKDQSGKPLYMVGNAQYTESDLANAMQEKAKADAATKYGVSKSRITLENPKVNVNSEKADVTYDIKVSGHPIGKLVGLSSDKSETVTLSAERAIDPKASKTIKKPLDVATASKHIEASDMNKYVGDTGIRLRQLLLNLERGVYTIGQIKGAEVRGSQEGSVSIADQIPD